MTKVFVIYEEVPENIMFSALEVTPEELNMLNRANGKYINANLEDDEVVKFLLGDDYGESGEEGFVVTLKKNEVKLPYELYDVVSFHCGFML